MYAETSVAAWDAARAVRDAVDRAASLGAVFLGIADGFEPEPDPRLHRVTIDVSLWHVES